MPDEGEEGDLGRGGVEFEEFEVRADLEALAEFGDGDAKLGGEGGGGVAGTDEVEGAGEAFAVGEEVEEGLGIPRTSRDGLTIVDFRWLIFDCRFLNLESLAELRAGEARGFGGATVQAD